VWDYNDLRGFLDGDRDLCAAYGHFITAGDVLSRMLQVLSLPRCEFLDVMDSFLQKELIADMSAKLQSAGEDPEVQIPLANVFVDLPYANSVEAATLTRVDDEHKAPKAIRKLLECASFVLRRMAQEDLTLLTGEGRTVTTQTSRFVIVGGPGQGKSTLGQYLCQLYRAAILKDRPTERLDERVTKIVKQLDNSTDDFPGLPITRRFPVRVELRTFSQALANETQLTLFEYIRRDIAHLGSADIAIEDLKDWLEQYPWLLVLDGLDEVPPSSNRAEVIIQIEHFRVDAATRNADLMIVATTRPQSYSKEFPEDLFRHLYLVALAPKQALHYGRKLAEARCGTDERRKEELIRSLEKACKNEATVRLMQSPLQVTIMATLLEGTGEPPQQRYRLFAEYYRTIYKRETRRKLLGGILSERQTDIDTIHAQAGLLLHAAGEKVPKRSSKIEVEEADSALSDEQFRELVRRRLERIKVPAGKASELLSRITDDSLQRLVFLVRPTEGWVRFDITSLKEFMAAEALMSGPDEIVRDRLETIAPANYWRNAFLFAIGKCFVEREHMLDTVVSLCSGLNEELVAGRILSDEVAGRAARAGLWGSRLALDILMDGTAHQYPEYELRLIRIGMELAKTPDVQSCARLASIYHDDMRDVYRDVIEDRLGQSNFWLQLGGWYLLMSLADRGVQWANKHLDDIWPTDVRQREELLFSRGRTVSRKWWLERVVELAPNISPWSLIHYPTERIMYEQKKFISEPWRKILEFIGSHHRAIEIPNRSSWGDTLTHFSLVPTDIGSSWSKAMENIEFEDQNWAPFVAAARFGANPTAKSLSEELRWLKDHWVPSQRVMRGFLPWPFAACVLHSKSTEQLANMAELASSGKLGDIREWQKAENRWKESGVREEDLLTLSDERWPFDANISQTGFPFVACSWSIRGTLKSSMEIQPLLSRLRSLPAKWTQAWFADVMLLLLEGPFETKWRGVLSPKDIRELFSLAMNFRNYWWPDLHDLMEKAHADCIDSEWVELFDWMGRQEGYHIEVSSEWPFVEQVVHHFCSDPNSKRGLLPIIAAAAVSGTKCQVAKEVLETAKRWGEQARDDAITLSFARNDLSPNELRDLANELAKSRSLNSLLWRVLKVASTTSPKQAAVFTLELLEILTADSVANTKAIQEARQDLVGYLTKMPSNLDVPGVWERLKLPERL
jgi:hypothetical protein